jgi:4-hydroxy-tetrahydrodipicolinate synthase/2-dehydro-3-deoxy-phosphogluconate/2-dehydro-3-deoxy-6-phosphogalactonate aldolase
MIAAIPEDFCVLCGMELLFNKALKAGVKGAILGMGNCFPTLLVQIWDAFKAGEDEKFESLWTDFSKVFPLQNVPFDYLPSLTKEILYAMGKPIDTQVRSPLRVLDDRMKRKIQQIIK